MDYRKEYQQINILDAIANKPYIEQIESKLNSIIGTHDLPLTPFSAKKVDGRKLYEYARE
jgi:tRNA U55 pseudouridine synthase TruB